MHSMLYRVAKTISGFEENEMERDNLVSVSTL